MDPDDVFDAMVNAIPGQGTETVRSEEALYATLSIINIIIRRN
ncbi:MAG: putative RNA uridine N3 methyltransferase [Candidatus Aenigmatarchaeota archaeon]